MANCIYCNVTVDPYCETECDIIGGDAYCKPCLYGENKEPQGWMYEPDCRGACKRCNREALVGQFSRLCNDCSDDMAS